MRDLSATELQAGVFTIVSCVATFVAYDIAGRRVAAAQPSESDRRRPRPRRVVGVMAVLLLLVGTAWWSVGTVGGSVAASSLPSPYSVAQLAFQLATNSVLLAPFVIWMVRRRRGSADFGIERADLGRSLAVGAAVSLACFLMSGRYAAAFWTSPDTLRLLIAMLGVGLSEEVLFRGILLGTLVRRMPRPTGRGRVGGRLLLGPHPPAGLAGPLHRGSDHQPRAAVRLGLVLQCGDARGLERAGVGPGACRHQCLRRLMCYANARLVARALAWGSAAW